MDPISILGTAIGVATLAAEVSKSLFKAADAISKSQEEARDLTDQLCSLTSILTTIKSIVEEKKELFSEKLFEKVQEITGKIEEIAEKVKRMMKKSKKNTIRLAFKLVRVKPLLTSIKAMESSLQTILLTMLVAKEQVKAPHERSEAHVQQKYANPYRLLAESRVENDRQVIQRLAFETSGAQRKYRDSRAVHHHLQGQQDTATWLYHLVFSPAFPQAPSVPNLQRELDASGFRFVGTDNTDEALREAQNYQATTLARESESVGNIPTATVPERKGTTTTQPSTSRRSTVSENSVREHHSETVSIDDDEEMNEDWESENSDSESDEETGNMTVLWNPNQNWHRHFLDSAATTVDNLLHKFTTLSQDQILASSQPVSFVSRPATVLGEDQNRSETPRELVGGSPSTNPASRASSNFQDIESESERERPPRRGRHPPSRSPIRVTRTTSDYYPGHPPIHRNNVPSPRPQTPRRNRNDPYHPPNPFGNPPFQAPESNPFHPSYYNPFNSPPMGASYAAPPPKWHVPQFNQPFAPYGPSFHRSPSPVRRRYRSWSPRIPATTAPPPPPPPPPEIREPTAEDKLRALEQKAQNERLSKLEDFARESREQQLQEEARESALAAGKETSERQRRDEQIQASLAELTSRQREEEAKRTQEQLVAVLDARREEAEVKAAAERERYLRVEVQHKEDVDRRVSEALAHTKEVFEKEVALLKGMAQEAAAAARAAMKSKRLAEAESAKRARDAVQKKSEEEKKALIGEYQELVGYWQGRVLEIEHAKAAAEALRLEQRAAPTRQLRLEDGDRRMELIETQTQQGIGEPLANTDFLASTFFHHRRELGGFCKSGRPPARPRLQRAVREIPSLSSEESEEDRRIREKSLLSGKTVVLLPPAENTSESEMRDIRTAISESGLSAASCLVPFKGRRAQRGKGITATFHWNSPLPAESQLLSTLKENGWKPVYRRQTELGQTWFIGNDPVHIDFFTPQYRPQINPIRRRRRETTGNVVIGSELIDEDAIKLTGIRYQSSQGFFVFGPDVSAKDLDTLISWTMLHREIDLHKAFYRGVEAASDEETESSSDDIDTYQSKEGGGESPRDSGFQAWAEGWNTDGQELSSDVLSSRLRSKHNVSRTSNRSARSTRTNASSTFQCRQTATMGNPAVAPSSLRRTAGMPGLRPQRASGDSLVPDVLSPGGHSVTEPFYLIPRTQNGPSWMDPPSPVDRPKSKDSVFSIPNGGPVLEPGVCHRRSRYGASNGDFAKEHYD